MRFKGEEFLDRRFGAKSPNLPTRILRCQSCGKPRSVKQIETGFCSGHRLGPEKETIWNYLRTLIRL